MAAAALATNSASAEATLKVPFNFTAAGKICPAGEYAVDRDLNTNLVTLRSKDASRHFRWILGPSSGDLSNSAVVLRFDEQGTGHSLRSIQYGATITSTVDKKDKHREAAPVQVMVGQ
jgi:hypothetical protein